MSLPSWSPSPAPPSSRFGDLALHQAIPQQKRCRSTGIGGDPWRAYELVTREAGPKRETRPLVARWASTGAYPSRVARIVLSVTLCLLSCEGMRIAGKTYHRSAAGPQAVLHSISVEPGLGATSLRRKPVRPLENRQSQAIGKQAIHRATDRRPATARVH